MPILAIFTGQVSKDQYDALRREVKWEENTPAGVLAHVASFDAAGGLHVAEVWESEAQLNEFVGTRLMPTFQKLGASPPNVEIYPAHNVNSYAGLDAYKARG